VQIHFVSEMKDNIYYRNATGKSQR